MTRTSAWHRSSRARSSIGTLTDRDIAIRVVAEDKDPQTTTVREVATTNVVTVDPQQDLDEALRLMAEHQVRRLPVVEEDGKLAGVVAQADIAGHASDAGHGEVVEADLEIGGGHARQETNVKNEKQYEALKDKGMSKERAAKIANSPGASEPRRQEVRLGSSRSSSSQGGTTAQKKAAGRKGGRATANKS